MSDWVDRIVAEAMSRAEEVFAEEAELGGVRWALPDGHRCYTRQDGPDFVITVMRPDGTRSVYELVGVDGSRLT